MNSLAKLVILILSSFIWNAGYGQPWEHYFPGSGQKYSTSIIESYDHGYIMSVVNENNGRSYIFKLDRDGNLLWTKTISSQVGGIRIQDICLSSDGGIMVCGLSGVFDSTGAAFIMKMDDCGEKIWIKEYGINGDYEFLSHIISVDNYYLTLGGVFGIDSINDETISLLKIDNYGNLLWQNNYSHYASSNGRNISLIDSAIYISGVTYYPHPVFSINLLKSLLIKVNLNGNEEWFNVYDTTNNLNFFIGADVINLGDSALLFLNVIKDSVYTTKYWNYLYKLDSSGVIQQQDFTSPTNDLSEDARSILKINDSTYIIISNVSYYYTFNTIVDYRLKAIKVDSYGNVIDSIQFGTGDNFAVNSFVNSEGKVVICGIHDYGSSWGPFVIKIKEDLSVDTLMNITTNYDSLCSLSILNSTIVYDTTTVGLNQEYFLSKIKIYPNPCNLNFTIDLNNLNINEQLYYKIYSIDGSEVSEDLKIPISADIYVGNYPSGMYYIRIYTSDRLLCLKKFIILR